MAQIALNKPSGGQLILVPEDGATSETVTIPSAGFGAGKILQVKEVGFDSPNTTTTVSGYTYTPLMTCVLDDVQEGSRLVVWMCSGQISGTGTSTNPAISLRVDGTGISRHNGQEYESTNHWWYGSDQRPVIQMQAVSGALSAGTHTVTMNAGVYNGSLVFNYQTKNNGSLLVMEVAA